VEWVYVRGKGTTESPMETEPIGHESDKGLGGQHRILKGEGKSLIVSGGTLKRWVKLVEGRVCEFLMGAGLGVGGEASWTLTKKKPEKGGKEKGRCPGKKKRKKAYIRGPGEKGWNLGGGGRSKMAYGAKKGKNTLENRKGGRFRGKFRREREILYAASGGIGKAYDEGSPGL